MPLMSGSKTYDPVDNFNTTPGLFDLHPAIGLYFATPTGHALVSLASPLPVTGAIGGVLDTDDNLIAPGQTTTLNIVENYIYDKLAGAWIRWEGGIDNSPTTSDQCGFVGGSVTDPLDVFADGDACCLHFDTSGRLLTTAAVTLALVTDDDDNSVAAGQLDILLSINENYIHNGSVWIRQQGGVDNAVAAASPQGSFVGGIVTDPVDVFVDGDVSLLHFDTSGRLLISGSVVVTPFATTADDNSIASGATLEYLINLNYVFNGTDWFRLQGAANNAVAPASPQGSFTVGVVRTSFDVFASGDAAVDQYTVDGAKIVIPRTQEPFEVLLSQATIAASGVLTSTAVQQNSLFAGSLGRHSLQGFVHYTGAASSLTLVIQISLDSGATFITTDTFTVVSGVVTIVRDVCIAMGNRLRIRITNNDGANDTGTTNIGFYLTHAN